MSLPPLAAHFSRALEAGGGKLHLAAHSHHLWPDVSYDGHVNAWTDAAAQWDDKWATVFGTVIPRTQAHIARLLRLPDPATIAFAANTHDLVCRLLSCLPLDRVPRILTTDAEFYSFARQIDRLAEDGLVSVERIPTEPFATFQERFLRAASRPRELVFLSQVFFNSGFAVPDMAAIVAAVPDPATLIAIDGYHGFMAVPTDLSAVAARAFYLSGGYKYAMAGEGAGFMHCPDRVAMRPRDTGWFAGFGALTDLVPGQIPYATGGGRFFSGTFDPTGLYRLNAVIDWLDAQRVTVAAIHAHVRALQAAFVAALDGAGIAGLGAADLVVGEAAPGRGNFLAYRSAASPTLHQALAAAGIVTDLRGEVLRIGFGLYHETAAMPGMIARVSAALR